MSYVVRLIFGPARCSPNRMASITEVGAPNGAGYVKSIMM